MLCSCKEIFSHRKKKKKGKEKKRVNNFDYSFIFDLGYLCYTYWRKKLAVFLFDSNHQVEDQLWSKTEWSRCQWWRPSEEVFIVS